MATAKFDTSTFGGLAFYYVESPEINDRGRGIFLTWENGDNAGMELLGYSIRYTPAEKAPRE